MSVQPVSVASRKMPALALSIAAIWLSVSGTSVFSPDLVSGSAQEHLPLAAMTTWLWGATATGLIVVIGVMRRPIQDSAWTIFAATVMIVWAVAAIVSIVGPELVTGTDPTRIPISALAAPVFALLVTGFTCVITVFASRE